MSTAIAEPVAEAEVLTALDFDTPPVEVSAPPVTEPVKFYFTPEKFTITWSMDKEMLATEPPTFEKIEQQVVAKAYIHGCGCYLCQPQHKGPMDPTAKTLWVKALRDPSRKQGRGALHMGDRWCALGVLIDLAIQAGVRLVEEVDPKTGATGYDGQYGALPEAVQRWAGVNGNPTVAGQQVAFLNDAGMPFRQIADLIEANL